MDVFKAKGGASLLMDADNGEIITCSLRNLILSKVNIHNKKFMNKITKGVFELGSIFKTFTALTIEKIQSFQIIIKDISQKIKCSVHEISDIKISKRDDSSGYIGSVIKYVSVKLQGHWTRRLKVFLKIISLHAKFRVR